MGEQAPFWSGISVNVRTGDRAKSSGALVMTWYQGSTLMLRREYGTDTSWPAETSALFEEPLRLPTTGEDMVIIVAFEQRGEPSETAWSADIRVVLSRSDGRDMEFAGSERFFIGPSRPMHLLEITALSA